MNFRQKITLYLLLYIAMCSAAFAQVVDIPDPNLRAVIREHMRIAEITEPVLSTRLVRLEA